jgi:class 3 adenylate cyclase
MNRATLVPPSAVPAPPALSPLHFIRSSFRWKLLTALLGSVSLLSAITFYVVRSETSRQIERVMIAAGQRSRDAFNELEQYTHAQLSQLSAVFTGSVQAAAALEAALETGDIDALVNDVNYEFDLRRIPHSLVAFTDAYGAPVLTMLDRAPVEGVDPAGVAALAERVLHGDAPETFSYVAVGEQLFSVETLLVDLGRPIGTVTIGVPIGDEDAGRLGGVIGAEICFIVDGRCVAGTPAARAGLHDALAGAAGRAGAVDASADDTRWRITADRMDPGDDRIWRVVAVPLDQVIAPFERIQRALLFGGLGALLLAAFIAALLARGLTRPVRALVTATSRIGAGDYHSRVDVTSSDEIGVLGRAFNEMAEGLALKERYRGVLDKVVSRDIADELLKGDVVLGGEKRTVTVVFGDIVNFTGMTDGMEPSRVISLLNECMERLTAVVEAEGGVVDKYVGDEIMALFGAPVARPHDELRAVRAALGMQAAMASLNSARAERGEPPLQIGIGMNTGECMAGNMGSSNRLNYTVLGDTVNMAARVRALAAGGEVLITEHTLRRVEGKVTVRNRGLRELRGFSQPVLVYEVVADVSASSARSAPVQPGVARALTLCLLTSGVLAALPAGAQVPGELPTLERVYVARGVFEAGLSGRFDLEAFVPNAQPAWIIPDTKPFVAPRLRLFADAFLGQRVIASAELRADRGEEPRAGPLEVRLDQLFVRLVATEALALQAGRFVTPFGGWAQRHHTAADPFIRPPLSYDHRTVLNGGRAPPDRDALLRWKNEEQNFRPAGAPVIWGAPYPWGAMALGHVRGVDWRAAVVNSAPSSEPEEWALDRGFDALSFIVHVGVQPHPALRVAASFNQGPWLRADATGLPPGTSSADFDQRIWGLEGVWRRGRSTLRGELLHDTWGVPNIGYDVVDISWYVEGETVLTAGLSVAARFGAIAFPALSDGGVYRGEAWDHAVQRMQAAVGYRIARNAGVRAEALFNRGGSSARLLSAQFWWEL